MEFRVLGPIEVFDDLGDRVPLPSKRMRTVLAVLLLRSGRVVSVDDLIDHLWGDGPHPDAPRAAVYTYIGRLRALIGPSMVISKAPGYLVTQEAADLATFRELVNRAATMSEAETKADLLTEALAQWRGAALSDVPSELLQRYDAAGLVEERLWALEQQIEARLDLGEHDAVLPQLAALTAEHPTRERFWAQRMTALHRADRQVEALDAYSRVALYLAQELGLDPSPELQQLRQSILINQPRPAETSKSAHRQALFQVPSAQRGFVGRDALCEELEGVIRSRETHAVAIDGPPGVGKTALAIQLAQRVRECFPDGQWYLRAHSAGFHPASNDGLVADLLRLAGVEVTSLPEHLDARTAALRAALADRRVLILIDDAASVEQIRAVLPGTGTSVLVATSRQSLMGLAALDGAHRVALGVLGPSDAIALVKELVGEKAVNDQPQAAAELAGLCGGLPLALRIAAAQASVRSGSSLTDQVRELRSGDRLAKLRIAGDPEAAVDRAFEVSFEKLPEGEQHAFRLLGLVPGDDFDQSAAAALFGVSEVAACELLNSLVAANLIEARSGGRYVLHDLLKLFAAKLSVSVRSAAVRLYERYLRVAADACSFEYRVLTGLRPTATSPSCFSGPKSAETWLSTERHNLIALIVAAEEVGQPEYAWRLTDVLRHYFLQMGLRNVWRTALDAGHRAALAADDRIALGLMTQSLGNLEDSQGNFSQALEHAEAALWLFRAAGYHQGEAAVIGNMAVSALGRGELHRAMTLLEQSRELFVKSGRPELATLVLTNLSAVRTSLGDLTGAVAAATEGLELDHRLSRPVGLAAKLVNRADAYRLLGQYELAQADLYAAMEIAAESARGFHLTAVHAALAETLLDAGRLGDARLHAEAALEAARQAGDRWHTTIGWRLLGDLTTANDRLELANKAYRRSLQIAEENGYRVLAAQASLGLAKLLHRRGRTGASIDATKAVLQTARRARMQIVEAEADRLLRAITTSMSGPGAGTTDSQVRTCRGQREVEHSKC
ncbi:AfsR/SARP family transcriptional regulator [Kribbella sp. CA-293567]|uniref:AfsR/SARP family transcriptional regulator n=1 Tax=Kribbella sp. CA-293567 TaxID=3002436 RepID=UPI0022DE61BC|nr:BTAD domain-containing putative transcriptional regulator [Kribbella sp. CA-293567]WBQ04370.1 BTAD domain-containing putative transcriptional regulator [Kribbella sp. CA-293567]